MSVFLSNQLLLEQVVIRCNAEAEENNTAPPYRQASNTKPDFVLSEECHGALKVLHDTMAARTQYKAQVSQRLLSGGVGMMALLLILWIMRRTVRTIDKHLQRLPGANTNDDDGAIKGGTACFKDADLENNTLATSRTAADSCSDDNSNDNNKSMKVAAYIGVVPMSTV